MAFFFPKTRQVFPGKVRPNDFGGPAPAPLSIPAPPNTAGYTTRTITAAEATGFVNTRDVAALSLLVITLDDATNYVISSPTVIRRPIILRGGSNIVWKGAHLKLDLLGVDFFPSANHRTALQIEDGASSPSGRIVHLEGHWYEGEDLGDSIILSGADVDLRIGYWRVSGAGARSSDAVGREQHGYPIGNSGAISYTGVEQHHPDAFKTNSDYQRLSIDRATIETSSTGLRFDHGETSQNYLSRVSVKGEVIPLKQETPFGAETQTWTQITSRANLDASQGNWTQNINSCTLTWPYATAPAPLQGTNSLRVQTTDPGVQFLAVGRTFASTTDWSDAGASTALSCLVHVVASAAHFPMMRIDASIVAGTSYTVDEGWYIGQSHNCTVGVTRRLVCPFPREVLASLERLRVLLLVDDSGAGSGSHEFIMDDFATGTGLTVPSFTGPTNLAHSGHSGLYVKEPSAGVDMPGTVYLKNFYVEANSGNHQKADLPLGDGDNTSYHIRYYDIESGGPGVPGYELDPAPGDATFVDFVVPAPVTTGSDSTGSYVTWDSTVRPEIRDMTTSTLGGSGRVYAGPPPENFCPPGVAGELYTSFPTYLPEIYCFAQGQSSATLAVAVPATVPLETAAATSSATLDLTAPSTGFSPTDIAGLYGWWDADQLGLANNDPVTSWTDESGNARHFTGAAAPLYKTGVQNGLPGLLFDGTDDVLTRAVVADASRTIFIVAKQSAAGVSKTLLGTGSNNARVLSSAAGAWQWNTNQAVVAVGLGGTVTNATVLSIVINSASSLDAYLDTGTATSFDPNDAATAFTSLTPGANVATSNYWNGYIFEVVAYDSALGTTDREDVRDYLLDKWIGGAAPAVVPLETAAGISSATLALAAPATVPLGTAAATSSATLALTARPTVALETAAATSSATLALRAPTTIALGTAAAQSSATLTLTAKPTVVLGTAAAVSSATLALTAPTRVVLATSVATSSATLALRAQTYIALGTAAASSSATLSVTAGPGVITAQASIAVSSATLALTARTQVVLATAAASSSATLALVTPSIPVIPLQSVAASSSATLLLFAGAIFQTHLPLTVEVQDTSLTVVIDEGDTSIIFDSSESTVIYDETTTDVASQGDRDAVVPEHLTSVDVAESVTTVDYEETPRTVEVP